MNIRTRIRIKKPKQWDLLIGIVLGIPLLCAVLVEVLGFPRVILYLCDAGWVCLLGLLMIQKKKCSAEQQKLSAWIVIFVIYTAMVYVAQYQSFLYYFWGFRNNFRFYIVLSAVAYFWREKHVRIFYQLMDMLFWINFVVTVIQFFCLGLSGDYLGGIFGAQQGVNGYSTIFMAIVIAKSIVFCFDKRESLSVCCAKCGVAVLIAAFAEMKFFFVEFLIIICVATIFTQFSWKKILLVICAMMIVILGSSLLSDLFGGDKNWLSFEFLYNLASSDKGYTSSGDLSRLNALSRVNELWLENGWQRLFGLGLGNCDTSSFAFLNTPFFEKYGDMHYTWLSYAMIYLETGLIGLIFYFGFFILVYREICKIQKHVQGEVRCYCQIGKIMTILCVIISVYNSSLRTEAGYMAYFVLALPFVYGKTNN